jgi:hypothetical protein
MRAGKPKTVTMPKSIKPLGVPRVSKTSAPATAKPKVAPTFAAKKAMSLGKKFS